MTATTTDTATRVGSRVRVEGVDKVSGQARYAFEYDADGPAYAWPVLSTIAKGRVLDVDVDAALLQNGVLAVLWHRNSLRLHDAKDGFVAVLQEPEVAYRGQLVALVVALSQEEAREAAERL